MNIISGGQNVWLFMTRELGSHHDKEYKDNKTVSSMIGRHLKNCPTFLSLRRYNHMTHDLRISTMSSKDY